MLSEAWIHEFVVLMNPPFMGWSPPSNTLVLGPQRVFREKISLPSHCHICSRYLKQCWTYRRFSSSLIWFYLQDDKTICNDQIKYVAFRRFHIIISISCALLGIIFLNKNSLEFAIRFVRNLTHIVTNLVLTVSTLWKGLRNLKQEHGLWNTMHMHR